MYRFALEPALKIQFDVNCKLKPRHINRAIIDEDFTKLLIHVKWVRHSIERFIYRYNYALKTGFLQQTISIVLTTTDYRSSISLWQTIAIVHLRKGACAYAS
ncbi:hypothetical protein H131_10238 [Lysinibacillus sphaericus OT4b.31]|uniref:Uncharacterized protein n=1 Tax=Lysinibacillus sphaericus OT4b.31 TaxID=1285586 RepID=R7ZEQ5_LYSSH|nr:hypothetical protein H131_10238 [Lysinibacillus sphaericus OT4b.31]